MGNEIVALRMMNYVYPFLDIAFLIFFCILLAVNKKQRVLTFGLLGGILYFIVDYGIFHLALGSRYIENANLFWVLLWMSMSYGLTNFAWIWLWFERDKNLFGYSLLIICWWITCPLMAQSFGAETPVFTIWRTTNSYHGVMALILFVSYAFLIVWNMNVSKEKKINIPWLLAIGILVQFAWEFSLLITGIRSVGMDAFSTIQTIVINSLVETNLGIPGMYFIFLGVNKWLDNRNKKKTVSVSPAIEP